MVKRSTITSDERNLQPQDELSDELLEQVSGGIGDGQQPVVDAGTSVEEKKKKPKEQQQYLQVELENVQITSYS